jgi:hypothetical protein
MVMSCPAVATETWCSQAINRQSIVDWHVCEDHRARLFAGDEWALVYEKAPSWSRWIVLGEDRS